MMNNAGLYWIAIELTTLVSTFLVGFERAAESIEAAWKYIIIISAGISLALLGTVLFYWCGSFVLGPTYDMTWGALRAAAPKMNPALAVAVVPAGAGRLRHQSRPRADARLAAGRAQRKPDADIGHALGRAAQLRDARHRALSHRRRRGAKRASGARHCSSRFGVISLLVGALFIVRQSGIKRLMAYSSVEHMGVVALGFGFGGPLGIAGALYHMLNHSLNKSLMFFGAGNVMRSYGSKEISKHPRRVGAVPGAGRAVAGGRGGHHRRAAVRTVRERADHPARRLRARLDWAVYVMAVLLIVIFIGFLNHFRAMYFGTRHGVGKPARAVSHWCVVPMWLRAGAAACVRRVVAERSVEPLQAAAAHPGGADAMSAPQMTALRPAQLKDAASRLLAAGGRMQMVYAWYPEPDGSNSATLASPAGYGAVLHLALRRIRSVPSLAGIWPLLGWYEREITDLFGLRFHDHPQPHRLVLHEGVDAAKPPFAPNYPLDQPLRVTRIKQPFPKSPAPRPTCNCCRSARCAPTSSNSPSFCSSISAKRSYTIIPRLFFKHRGMEKRFEGLEPQRGVVLAERVSARRQRGARARVLSGGRGRVELQRAAAREGCACCWPSWSGSTTICIISAISATPRRSRWARPKASCWRSGRSRSTRELTGSRFLRSVLGLGGLRRDLSPKPWLGPTLDDLRETFAQLCAAPGKYRKPSRPADHDRACLDRRTRLRSGRDRADRACLRASTAMCGATIPTPPMASFRRRSPVREEGDAHARAQVRMEEIDASIELMQRVLAALPDGPVRADCTSCPTPRALGWTESPRGTLVLRGAHRAAAASSRA